MYRRYHYLLSLFLFISFLPIGQAAPQCFNNKSIECGLVAWTDFQSRNQLLKKIPIWSSDQVSTLFETYQHPEHLSLPYWINGHRVNYNAVFIQSLWGPVDNVFVSPERPAKLFVLIKNTESRSGFFMAPVVRNSQSGNYLVFDKTQTKPVNLYDWVKSRTTGPITSVYINICSGYGVKPDQACEGGVYENEIYDYQNNSTFMIQQGNHVSAVREVGQDWQDKVTTETLSDTNTRIYHSSVSWGDSTKRNEKLKAVIAWQDYDEIETIFQRLRDSRYFQDEVTKNFARRISWLFPDDGCSTRLAAMIKDFFGPINNPVNNKTRPSKVFAFGNLCMLSENTLSGSIRWWYHTAPVVRDQSTKQIYVLDPAIEPNHPILIDQWMEKISANDGACADESYGMTNQVDRFNICNGYGSEPYQFCEFTQLENFEKEIRPMLFQRFYRRLERQRQLDLGRDVLAVLGDSPPWLTLIASL